MPESKRIAMLVADGFTEETASVMRAALRSSGCEVVTVSDQGRSVRSWRGENWGEHIPVDRHAQDVSADEFEGLVIPDGLLSTDQLRRDGDAVSFVREFFEAGKPVAAAGHAPQLFVDAQVLEGKLLTSNPSIEFDVRNAGGVWQSASVVQSGCLITAQSEESVDQLMARFTEVLRGEGQSGADYPVEIVLSA